VADRLAKTVKTLGGEACLIGRLGGDEFSVIALVSRA